MNKQLVFGHSNPDTDAIVAAKAFAYLQNQLGVADAEAVALGNPNPETAFVLAHFDEATPRVIETAANEVDSVMLVDHNESQQSVSDLDQVTVTAVVDHHRIANFETSQPLFYRAEPVGCTSTILTKLFHENNVEIPAKLAGLMLSAIVSDTLLLKSPTTTDDDRKALEELAKIANIDVETYGLEMLKAGTDLSSKSELELVDGDAKSFDMGGKTIRIGQVNTVDLDDVFSREAALVKTMEEENQKNGYDMFLLLATNILSSDSRLLVVGEPKDIVEKAFNTELSDHNTADLPGVVSRKKQVVPPLMDAFA
ncbi:manganese-dependent inorganic pyrophosphatase [Pediococcus pentosaceus]|jgi:manganese-dependent inorganic pyrophosphatase|uniref:Probable manganese-dependent inorganic pyrophosphatase n=1 Tax=Pediococcus pentosaceus (strain ATCC 25745 / CCUG 21536 / LMG 10740 / 183-1w) TaxID=278197 RepID=Q03FL0_PEDPA|nr:MULTISPECIES: manganese-dependent inorganic pyrophosphatase [Pediococcus]ABJ68012.1 Inorganic pyrophosphatase/exopolyphosphatase [Pediococcus pentosaceus ATCC 25745]KAF0393383.1 manganese-dependent inorganic pyrophosphatase [Pediococcus pentosaceus]KAF0433628.1 manganese-dependent inorganic pyrophosphatase [Pediococcus pentosaceus]KAF0441620.1 manganese-dependent inorganic pyrophosphatase [Pediococcus pentosaceus]KAF0468647.1 manganese-dependent inorganic pyrophosphatase [Pediococcus pentos